MIPTLIDAVNLYQHIPLHHSHFKRDLWQTRNNRQGELYSYRKIRGVVILYYWTSQRMVIRGKLITLLCDTQVLNVDDLYGQDIPRFLRDINSSLNRLFTEPVVEIGTFRVSRIDYCFNVITPHVAEYIAFLNLAFQKRQNPNQVNYALENGLTGSVYVRNKREYRQNIRDNWTLNFYDKTARLQYQAQHGTKISKADWDAAKDALRLEAQLSYRAIQSIRRKTGIANEFQNFLDAQTAYSTIETLFRRVFGGQVCTDFYSYECAKSRVPQNSSARNVLLRSAQNHAITDTQFYYGRKRIETCGIYPYAFLPASWNLSVLPNPLKLITDKITAMDLGA